MTNTDTGRRDMLKIGTGLIGGLASFCRETHVFPTVGAKFSTMIP
jgi:hypothetical protein